MIALPFSRGGCLQHSSKFIEIIVVYQSIIRFPQWGCQETSYFCRRATVPRVIAVTHNSDDRFTNNPALSLSSGAPLGTSGSDSRRAIASWTLPMREIIEEQSLLLNLIPSRIMYSTTDFVFLFCWYSKSKKGKQKTAR